MQQILGIKKKSELRWGIIQIFNMKWSRNLIIIFAIAGLIPPLIFRSIAWYNGEVLSQGWTFYKSLLVSVISTVTISVGVVSVMMWLHKKYPWKDGIFKRLMLEIILTTFTSLALITTITILTHFTILPKEDLRSAIFNYLIVALLMNFVLVAITEGIFFFRQWKISAIEAERFKKESIRAQFESLKNQVNPHFLFNSLNTLSSLIDHDKEVSKEFLDDLSMVYRYVLQNKNEEVVPLEIEVEFINAFTKLLKKRHGNGVTFQFDIASEYLQKGIPPMTLQLLIENAVKHNITSRKKPLTVEIFSKDEMLVVRNNKQLKKKKVVSTGIGLNNIHNRYEYLGEKNIEIIDDNKYFEIKIPLFNFS